MTIAESYIKAINEAFRYIVFQNRDHDYMLRTFGTKIHGSANVSIIPPIQGFKIETIDETHDKVTFSYDDYTFECVFTWQRTNGGFVFIKCE